MTSINSQTFYSITKKLLFLNQQKRKHPQSEPLAYEADTVPAAVAPVALNYMYMLR